MVHENGLIAPASPSLITLYFWRVNTKGIHESSDQALRIMGATTVMGVIMIVWCLVTLAVRPEKPRSLPPADARPCDQARSIARGQADPRPAGQAGRPARVHRPHVARRIAAARPDATATGSACSASSASSIAFGHSILAMSGEETLAQVYREVESPKLKNFKKRGVRRLRLQPAVHVADQLLRRDDHSR